MHGGVGDGDGRRPGCRGEGWGMCVGMGNGWGVPACRVLPSALAWPCRSPALDPAPAHSAPQAAEGRADEAGSSEGLLRPHPRAMFLPPTHSHILKL